MPNTQGSRLRKRTRKKRRRRKCQHRSSRCALTVNPSMPKRRSRGRVCAVCEDCDEDKTGSVRRFRNEWASSPVMTKGRITVAPPDIESGPPTRRVRSQRNADCTSKFAKKESACQSLRLISRLIFQMHLALENFLNGGQRVVYIRPTRRSAKLGFDIE